MTSSIIYRICHLSLFKDNWERPLLDNIDHVGLSESQANWIERAFEGEEVQLVVFKFESSKG